MSFYQEYLKKQKSRGKEIPEEDGIGSIKEKTEGGPEIDIAPPSVPIQINSDNTKSKFSEIQKREEMERQNFINRVKGKNVPLPEIIENEPKEEDVRINVPQKPPRSEKILIRVIIILALLAILAIISLLWYRTVRNGGATPTEVTRGMKNKEVFVSETMVPVSFFNV